MPRNMGSIDRFIRIVIAGGVGALIALKVVAGAPAVILAVLAGIFLLTSIVGFCPAYFPFKFSTLGKKS